jgi:hypothetical protein
MNKTASVLGAAACSAAYPCGAVAFEQEVPVLRTFTRQT